MILNLDFANNNISSYFFFFFLIMDIYFIIPVVVTQVFNPIAELVIPIGVPTKETEANASNNCRH